MTSKPNDLSSDQTSRIRRFSRPKNKLPVGSIQISIGRKLKRRCENNRERERARNVGLKVKPSSSNEIKR